MGSFPLVIYNPVAASSILVSFFWQETVWDRGKLEDILPSSIVAQILLASSSSGEADLICWVLASDDMFHLRSAWELVRCSRLRDVVFSIIWQQHIYSQVSFFL